MEDIRVYEFLLKLNTFLKRQEHLANKMMTQELKLSEKFMEAKGKLPPEIFQSIFIPMMNIIEGRISTMAEMSESSQEMLKHIQDFHIEHKGKVQ